MKMVKLDSIHQYYVFVTLNQEYYMFTLNLK
jgi:hypothetical protein